MRELLDCHPQPAFRRRVRVPARYCPHCRKPVRLRVPGVLPRKRMCNGVLARAAAEHYLDGVPMGTVVRRLGVPKGAVFNEMHHLAALLGREGLGQGGGRPQGGGGEGVLGAQHKAACVFVQPVHGTKHTAAPLHLQIMQPAVGQ